MRARRTRLALAFLMLAAGGAAAQTALDRPPATTETPPAHVAPTPQMQAARKAMREACAGDIAKFCADAQDGRGGVMKCLRGHAADVSAGCRDAGQAMHDARAAARG